MRAGRLQARLLRNDSGAPVDPSGPRADDESALFVGLDEAALVGSVGSGRAQSSADRALQFLMKYDGLFTRPAGLIYGSFNPKLHVMPRFSIPPEWHRFVGLDFGPVNTAAVFFAEERQDGKPTGRLLAYREYKPGERSIAEHCYYLMKGDKLNPAEPRIPICAGGSKSEDRWRREFGAGGRILLNGKEQRVHGIPIHGPGGTSNDATVEVGINRVWKAFSLGQLIIFDDLRGLLDELGSYSREVDDMGEPTEKIADKEIFHRANCLGYLLTYLNTK